MTDAPAFQLYAADIYMDTNEWSAEAVGIYTRLLFHQWVNGSIPKDIKKLSQIALVSIKILSKRWPEMEMKFTFDETLRGRNLRLEKTRQKQMEYSEKQRKKGKKRAEVMWKDHIAVANTTAIDRLQSGYKPKHSPSSSSSSSIKRNNIFIIPELSEIAAYCIERKTGINPQTFFDHYSSNGWMVGKNKMKDWKAAIRTWEARGGNQNAGIRTNRSDPRDKTLQSREDAEVAAITAKWEASKKSASNNPGGAAGNDDAPDFSGE